MEKTLLGIMYQVKGIYYESKRVKSLPPRPSFLKEYKSTYYDEFVLIRAP